MTSDRPRPARRPRAAEPADAAGASRADAIYDALVAAIVEHRLKPGAKLTEDRLATLYGVSRTVIHAVLLRLAHEMVVTLIPNRGAFVASPTVDDARDVFEVRRLLEPRIVEHLCARVTRQQVAKLRAHVRLEARARADGDRRAIVRLSGEFHMLLAEFCGNRMFHRAMRELTALTCLIILLYDAPTSQACQQDEHDRMVRAIEQGDAAQAVKLMRHHLDHIESALRLDMPAVEDDDLARALGVA